MAQPIEMITVPAPAASRKLYDSHHHHHHNHHHHRHHHHASSGTKLETMSTSSMSGSTAAGESEYIKTAMAPTTTTTPVTLRLSRGRAVALVLTLTGAAFINTLSAQSVVIILPAIGKTLDIPDSRLQWIVSAYSLVFGCFLLLWGRLADVIGRRTIFLAGSVWVAVTVALCPLMPNELTFDLFRGLHGLGAAANVPTAIGILGATFPPGRTKNYAFATYGAGAPLGSIFGCILSGVIAQYANWKWVFGVTALLAAIISLAGHIVIPEDYDPSCLCTSSSPSRSYFLSSQPSHPSMAAKLGLVDWTGGLLITSSLLALLFALTEGNVFGWDSGWIGYVIAISLLLFVVFVAWQRRLERNFQPSGPDSGRPPLVKLSLVLNNTHSNCNKKNCFPAVLAIMGLFSAAFSNFLVFDTYYYQDYRGYSTLQTMLRFLPTGLGGLVVSTVVALLLGGGIRRRRRSSPPPSSLPSSSSKTAVLMAVGTASTSVACLLFALPLPDSAPYVAWGLPAMLLAVVGADVICPCLALLTSQAVPATDQALGGALLHSVGQLGRAVGLAIATALHTAVMTRVRTTDSSANPLVVLLAGLRAAAWFNFALAATAFFVVAMAARHMHVVMHSAAPSPPKPPSLSEEEDIGMAPAYAQAVPLSVYRPQKAEEFV